MYRGGFYRGGADPHERDRGHRSGAVGHQGQGSRPAGPFAARRPGARQDQGLSLDRRRPSLRRRQQCPRGGGARLQGDQAERLPRKCRSSIPTRRSTPSVETIATVREAVGPHIGIGVDFHGRVHKPMAKVLAKELEPFKLMFIEEPVLSENRGGAEGHRQSFARRRSRWASGSSRAGTSSQFSSDGYVDIIQPDPSHAGGITECRKIAAMAEAYDVAAGAALPARADRARRLPAARRGRYNAFIQEQSLGIHYNKGNDILDYIVNKEVFHYEDGFVVDPAGARARRRGGRGLCRRTSEGRPPLAQPGLAP